MHKTSSKFWRCPITFWTEVSVLYVMMIPFIVLLSILFSRLLHLLVPMIFLNQPAWIFQDVVKKVENVEVDGTTPKKDCVIADSGILPLDAPFNVDKEWSYWCQKDELWTKFFSWLANSYYFLLPNWCILNA